VAAIVNSSPKTAAVDLLIWVVIGTLVGTVAIGVGGQLLSAVVIIVSDRIPGNELFGWGASLGAGTGAAAWTILALRRRFLTGGE
jgi:hypothetical protein